MDKQKLLAVARKESFVTGKKLVEGVQKNAITYFNSISTAAVHALNHWKLHSKDSSLLLALDETLLRFEGAKSNNYRAWEKALFEIAAISLIAEDADKPVKLVIDGPKNSGFTDGHFEKKLDMLSQYGLTFPDWKVAGAKRKKAIVNASDSGSGNKVKSTGETLFGDALIGDKSVDSGVDVPATLEEIKDKNQAKKDAESLAEKVKELQAQVDDLKEQRTDLEGQLDKVFDDKALIEADLGEHKEALIDTRELLEDAVSKSSAGGDVQDILSALPDEVAGQMQELFSNVTNSANDSADVKSILQLLVSTNVKLGVLIDSRISTNLARELSKDSKAT